jgi:hypothetical protein
MIIPVVTGDIDPAAVEDLIALCVRYHQLRTQAAPAAPVPAAVGTSDPEAPETEDRTASPDARDGGAAGAAVPAGLTGAAARHADQAAMAADAVADALAAMEQQILGKILQVVSGPGGAASFLRRHLLGNSPRRPLPAPGRRPALVRTLYL